MKTPEVPVNPAILVWARHRAGASQEQAAKKAGIDVARLHSWESGTEQPTVAQLRHLADLYKRPLAIFLLDNIPRDFTVMKAFRRLPDSEDLDLSFTLAGQLRLALQRREIAVELSRDLGEVPIEFKERASLADNAASIASRFRSTLGIAVAVQESWNDDYEAYRWWRQHVEERGVLAFQVSRVDVEEMRGLSMFFTLFPIILLNSADAVRGRIFSLAHELGHLLLRCEARRDPASVFNDPYGKEEIWCNEFAGCLLVPPSELSWRSSGRNPDDFDWDHLKYESDRFRVSREVILRRLLEGNRLTIDEYKSLRRELHRKTPHKRPKPDNIRIPQDLKVVSGLGIPFVRTVVAAYRQEKITLSDVADYLNVKVKHVPNIEVRVLNTGRAGGE